MGQLRTAARPAVASSMHGGVQRRQAERWAADDQRLRQAAPTARAPAGTAELLAQLKTLGELRHRGGLTEDEFEAQKRKLLAR